jgi:hypothetical protein
MFINGNLEDDELNVKGKAAAEDESIAGEPSEKPNGFVGVLDEL